MKRRDFLVAGAAVGATAATSCGTALPLGAAGEGWLSLTPGELDDYLARVDRGMDAIARGTILPRPATEPDATPERASEEALAKQGLRALLFTSAYLDLDARSREHPEVQKRLERWMPEVDEAVLGMTSKIAELTPERAAAVQRVLREDPELGLTISEKLEQPAKLFDVPLKRRLQMRSMITHYAWRMRVQSPSIVADEYLTKMHRVAALSGKTEELKRELAARITNDAFWRYETLVARDDPKTAEEPGAPGVAPAGSRPATPPPPAVQGRDPQPTGRPVPSPFEPEPKPRRGRGLMVGGGITGGIGAVVFGVGAGLVWGAGNIIGAFMMTFGGIGVLVGLILLIVGAALR